MTDDDTKRRTRALSTLAAEQEARGPTAIRQNDLQAVREIEVELSRVWSRYCDVKRQVA